MQLASQEFWPPADASSLCTTSCVSSFAHWEHILLIAHRAFALYIAQCTHLHHTFCTLHNAHPTLPNAPCSYVHHCTQSTHREDCAKSFHTLCSVICFAICTMCKSMPPCTMWQVHATRSQQLCMRSLKKTTITLLFNIAPKSY